jgi:hypothetical protein
VGEFVYDTVIILSFFLICFPGLIFFWGGKGELEGGRVCCMCDCCNPRINIKNDSLFNNLIETVIKNSNDLGN